MCRAYLTVPLKPQLVPHTSAFWAWPAVVSLLADGNGIGRGDEPPNMEPPLTF